jgi:para-aminobenzoate synthetase component 1
MPTNKINALCGSSTPLVFITDFEGDTIECYSMDELEEADIEFVFHSEEHSHTLELEKQPVSYEHYVKKLKTVQEQIRSGNTYLLNLTQPTPVTIPASLQTIFTQANAPFKLRYKDNFVCFSPEKFVEIIDGKIYTYPMKGTIDASIPDAESKILSSEKEMAEHLMVVDLLRNDLGMVATDIRVEKFRYVDKIKAGHKELLQVSSQISGKLPKGWQHRFGTILKTLLPAGSISGTPKKRTVEIIKSVEGYKRGYFTGVFGYFDGKNLYSAVMIRYIEKTAKGYIYKSGGGITLDSDARSEYEELLDKVYIP